MDDDLAALEAAALAFTPINGEETRQISHIKQLLDNLAIAIPALNEMVARRP